MKTNKVAFSICFLIFFIFFSILFIIQINEMTLEKVPISSYLIYLIGIICMPTFCYSKICEPFLQIKKEFKID